MDTNTQENAIRDTQYLIDRSQELHSLASLLPLDRFTPSSNRVYNVWGERGAGKSTLIEMLREGTLMREKKVLWLSPASPTTLDTPQEFIAACSKGLRYPKEPEQEENLSEKLNDSQRGKVDPVRSDDSILITRSSVASNKRPYINAAASASVGRTSFVRDDLEISLGFGNNPAGNQAEAFLEALPLQSLGTDLIILFISETDLLSGSVRDWLRDYVIPAASQGPYRRNLVVLTETNEPARLLRSEDSWGDWDKKTVDFRAEPIPEDSIYAFALNNNCSPQEARFAFIKSVGYPEAAFKAVHDLANGKRNAETIAKACRLFAGLPANDQEKLAACCLPEILHADELDALFGRNNGRQAMTWLLSLPDLPLKKTSQKEESYSLSDDFRLAILNEGRDREAVIETRARWLPYARLARNAPSKSERTKLLLLAGLNWIESNLCKSLFGEKSAVVFNFITSGTTYFIHKKHYAHISESIRPFLKETSQNMRHVGITSIEKRAKELWGQHEAELLQSIRHNEEKITETEARLHSLRGKQSQLASQLKLISPDKKSGNSINYGKLIVLLSTLSITLFATGIWLPSPQNLIGFISAWVSICLCLCLVPGWIKERQTRISKQRGASAGSPASLQHEHQDALARIHTCEESIDSLHREIAKAREALEFPYV